MRGTTVVVLPQDVWNPLSSYKAGDRVFWFGDFYIAATETRGDHPGKSEKWLHEQHT